MAATLRGPNGQSILEPTSYPYTIGRSPDNQLAVHDAKVSSHHAEIRFQGQGYEIIDLGSSNGTFVNEQRVAPYAPRLLSNGDQIRLGNSGFLFEAGAMPSQPPVEATVYGGSGQGSNPSYAPTVAAPPPSYIGNEYVAQQSGFAPAPPVPVPPLSYTGNEYVAQQAGYTPAPAVPVPPPLYGADSYGMQQAGVVSYPPPPTAPQQKRGRRGLWITLGAIIAVLLIAAIAFGVIGYVNRSTSTKTLNAFCSALKSGNYPAAYNQLSSGLQAKFGSEAAFAAGYANNGGLGKVTSCSVGSVDDGAGTGTINYTFSGGSALVVDYTLVDENGWKINAQHPRSTQSLTLNTYCNALSQQDYQTAYDQFSTTFQHQSGTEAQFAAAATGSKIKGCTVSNVNDSAKIGTLIYSRGDGNKVSESDTLINENGTWKINDQQLVSTPTETLLTYCSALKSQDYQTAYNQLSSSAQSQETEAQFAANFKSVTVNDCTVSNVNDTAGTGQITYTLNGTNVGAFDYTLVNENNTWKINSEKQHA